MFIRRSLGRAVDRAKGKGGSNAKKSEGHKITLRRAVSPSPDDGDGDSDEAGNVVKLTEELRSVLAEVGSL